MDAHNNGAIKFTLLAMLALIIFLSLFSSAQSDEMTSPIATPTPEVWIPNPDDNCGGMVPAQCLSKLHFAFLPMIESGAMNE